MNPPGAPKYLKSWALVLYSESVVLDIGYFGGLAMKLQILTVGRLLPRIQDPPPLVDLSPQEADRLL